MIVQDQSRVVSFLADPASHGGGAVERIDTHGAMVFLVGTRAYKLKRAVRFPFLDYGSLAARKAACEAELRLNRRTAPAIYRSVAAVTRESDGRLAIGGDGEAVDWLVVMNRFDQESLFDRMAARGALSPRLMRRLADAIARFHDRAERRPDHGGRAAVARIIDGNRETLGTHAGVFAESGALDRIARVWRDALDAGAELLEERRVAGYVRWCHGDLHLRNICLIDGAPTLFDGIEFSEDIACIDVMYDLAFLLMDLQHRGLRADANLVLSRYLSRTLDVGGLALLPLFQSLRAGVRAMVSAIEADEAREATGADAPRREARAYLDLAFALARPVKPVLVAIGGLSGTGKSTLAAALAPEIGVAPGALVLRSDVLRKRLFDVEPEQRLPTAAYRREVTRQVYRRLGDLAGEALHAGHSVILDAVFSRPGERRAAAAIAKEAKASFHGLWLEAPAEVLRDRLGARRDDASDATPAVLDQQLGSALGNIGWRRFDGAATPDRLLAEARAALAPVPAGER